MKKDWDSIYRKEGAVTKEPSSLVVKNLKMLRKHKAKRVLDVGCGTGRHAILLAENGFEVVGIDPSEEALKIMMETARERGVAHKIEPIKGVQEALPFGDGSFDVVIAIYTFHHSKIDGAKKTAGEFYRVLRSGGLLVMNCISTKDHRYGRGQEIEPNTFIKFGEIDDDIPHHFFTEDELRGLLEPFRIIEFAEHRAHGNPPFTPGLRSHWAVVAQKP